MEAQINASAFDAAMAEEITYGLEWRTLPEKMHGQSMAKNVRTAKARGTDAQEKTPLAGLPSTLTQVLHQGGSDFIS